MTRDKLKIGFDIIKLYTIGLLKHKIKKVVI